MSAILEAKDEIRELMATYAMAMDACRFADVGACFAPDAEWITNYGAARGPDESRRKSLHVLESLTATRFSTPESCTKEPASCVASMRFGDLLNSTPETSWQV